MSAAPGPDGPDGPDPADPAGPAGPADAAHPTGGARRTVVVLPVVEAGQAVAVAVLRGVRADAVPCARGVALVPRGPLAREQVVGLSRSAGRHDVLVLTLADEQVGVERWRAGRLVDTPAYGAVGGVDGDAERVLLGRLDPREAAGHASTDGVDRAGASRTLLSGAAGPVRTWQVVLTALLLAVSVALLAVNVSALVTTSSTAFRVGTLLPAALWVLLTAYFARQLVRQLRRRGQARARDAAVGEAPGDDVGQGGVRP